MKPLSLILGLALVPAAFAATAHAQAAVPLPTQDQLQEAFDAGNYQDVQKGLNRLLALKGKAADPYDRSALLSLRGETHLRQNMPSVAATDFEEAAKATGDRKKSAASSIVISNTSPMLLPLNSTARVCAMNRLPPPIRSRATLCNWRSRAFTGRR